MTKLFYLIERKSEPPRYSKRSDPHYPALVGEFNLLVYVINQDGKPLMPCVPAIARLLLKEGKARVLRKTPFTIKMLVETEGYTQEVVAGMDTGSKKLGCAAVANGCGSRSEHRGAVRICRALERNLASERRSLFRCGEIATWNGSFCDFGSLDRMRGGSGHPSVYANS